MILRRFYRSNYEANGEICVRLMSVQREIRQSIDEKVEGLTIFAVTLSVLVVRARADAGQKAVYSLAVLFSCLSSLI